MAETGHCLCGAVSFSAAETETTMHGCHCSMCRRWSGGPALVVAAGGVEFDGSEHLRRFDSSDWAERGFCALCGSNLFYRLKEADQYYLAAGAFDDQSKLHLSGEIFIDEKPGGYEFAGDHSRLTGEQFLASLGAD